MKGSALPTLAGATRYEFRMQIRRKAVWITLLLFTLLLFTGEAKPWELLGTMSAFGALVTWAVTIQFFMPIAFGCLLADRLPRERRTGTAELLDTLPDKPGARLTGKFLGSVLATALPIFLVYLAGAAYIAQQGGLQLLPLCVLVFLTVNVPGLLFVAAFSIACPVVLWVPLYQFLFVGYWFWGNLLPPYTSIPTLTGTWLSPLGEYAAVGFFGVGGTYVTDSTPWEGLTSIALLLTLGALALFCAHRVLCWRRTHQ